jgi:hypothetical protein
MRRLLPLLLLVCLLAPAGFAKPRAKSHGKSHYAGRSVAKRSYAKNRAMGKRGTKRKGHAYAKKRAARKSVR